MWPFGPRRRPRFRRIDDRFSATGQIRPEDLPAVAEAGFRVLVCIRRDGEDRGQPQFAAIAAEARRHGLTARHLPSSVPPTPGQLAALRRILAEADGPVLGWCRSGARVRAMYALACRGPVSGRA
ncbi:TIGR01244 family protein [Paracoccus thiocyanatus]|uniref:TIGR01244 family protein n=1 Tax=Paracoccus thiocyanatus TaxID=34006 RepID=A0A1N6TZG2_9RHOB|nr:TIGR01244 family sulfur transferase [Paracoccus thiocyanatus]SIQ58677.1 TIGR01244 family protein [Paracoccus thiocyanatus]